MKWHFGIGIVLGEAAGSLLGVFRARTRGFISHGLINWRSICFSDGLRRTRQELLGLEGQGMICFLLCLGGGFGFKSRDRTTGMGWRVLAQRNRELESAS